MNGCFEIEWRGEKLSLRNTVRQIIIPLIDRVSELKDPYWAAYRRFEKSKQLPFVDKPPPEGMTVEKAQALFDKAQHEADEAWQAWREAHAKEDALWEKK